MGCICTTRARYNEGQVRLWPFPRANGDHTIEVLRRLRAAFPDEALIVLWDGAPYHRAKANTVHLGMRQADAVGRVFRDRLRWLVLLPAFRLAFVLATTSASA